MKLFIFILLTFSALNPALVYSSCEEAFVPLTSVQEEAQKSVWAVHSLDSSGTGFFIGPSIFVTNVHVVSQALLTLNGIKGITLTQEGNPLILKVKGIIHFSVTYDLAVLKIEGEVIDSLDLKQGVPRLKDNLFLIGYPNGNSQVIDKTGDIFDKSELDYTFPGNSSNNSGASGSPVLNTDGEVVGVLHAGNGNALHAVKIIHLQNLLKQKVEFFRSPKDHLEHSIKEAIEAAEQGSGIAQNNLAAFYRQGLGVKQDFEKAIYWYKKAAEQGSVIAQNNLAAFYWEGVGVKQDDQEAVKWWKKAAEQGDANAQNNLGSSYRLGRGVKQDFKKAIYWYKKAAEQGDADAQFALGYLYDEGLGVQKNYKEAFKWYKKAAEQGDVDAQFALGYLYDEGLGVQKNYKEAVKWYKKSAKQGHAFAQYSLALSYRLGRGVKQDDQEAIYWYKKAAKQGYAPAQIALSKLEAS